MDNCLRDRSSDIAIVGLSLRFPGAESLEEYWKNLQEGREVVANISGVNSDKKNEPEGVLHHNFIPTNTRLKNVDLFDANFFGMSRREAEIMDPQHRIFMECAWEALENAGYDPQKYKGLIGMYAGIYADYYFLLHVFPRLKKHDAVSEIQTMILNEKDHLTTYAAYKLNLKGPVVTVQTACSTSLVAIHMACESLLTYSSDIVIAGGATISFPQLQGYYYSDGGLLSKDGHCRAFDAQASGTIYGDGVGVVVLKRFEDALHDGDHIYAIINGTAINNDGATRAGYTAPGVNGQIQVISRAQKVAGVSPDDISYIEAHGTGTPLGDRIELEALQEVFKSQTDKKAFCAVGSVKSNIGHLGPAAGVSGVIKTLLALQHKMLPPQINIEEVNQQLDMNDSPFYFNTFLSEWESESPRRAGVSSFGLGGTNVHIIMEEPPVKQSMPGKRKYRVAVLSAKTEKALEKRKQQLLTYLKNNINANPDDLSYTLQVGRQTFEHRFCFLYKDILDAISKLSEKSVCLSGYRPFGKKSVTFILPKETFLNTKIIKELFEEELVFRKHFEICLQHLEVTPVSSIEAVLAMPELQKQLIFSAQVALSRSVMELGVVPEALIGDGTGHLVAAHLAGLINFKNAMKLVLSHAPELDQDVPTGDLIECDLYISGLKKMISVKNVSLNFAQQEKLLTNADNVVLNSFLTKKNQIAIELSFTNSVKFQIIEDTPENEAFYIQSLLNSNGEACLQQFYQCLATFWFEGVEPDWIKYHAGEKRFRIPLPTYPFDKKRYWIEPEGETNEQEVESKEIATYTYLEEEHLKRYKPARTETESTIVSIWEEALGIKPVGINDNFFELGGNSLLGVKIHEKICNEINVLFELREFFESQTIENISEIINERTMMAGEI